MVSEEEVRRFCKVCDFYKEGQVCTVVKGDQGNYVFRNWCGWAQIEGKRAYVTNESVRVNGKDIPRVKDEELRNSLSEKVANKPLV